MDVLSSLFTHPAEFGRLFYFQFLGGRHQVFPPLDVSELAAPMQRCYYYLDKTSRSFAAVIKALNPEMRPAICIFYLVLRGLDTVEDDPEIEIGVKKQLLTTFHEKLYEPGWKFDGCGQKEKDRELLVEFSVVIEEFMKLKKGYRDVIQDICKRMGAGMAECVGLQVQKTEDYYLYCHYVAGLVGIGLSQLFASSGLEDPLIGKDEHTANSMGLFLQKTNIIRDYLEDLQSDRTWYPREIWVKYVEQLGDMALPQHRSKALACLNHMITDALQHVPDVFKYMSRLKDQTIFNFCAIPQVMAIATLAECYNNYGVFKGVVKIRKSLAVSLMLDTTNINNLFAIFEQFLTEISEKVPANDPSAADTHKRITQARELLAVERAAGRYTHAPKPIARNPTLRLALVAAVVGAVGALYVNAAQYQQESDSS